MKRFNAFIMLTVFLAFAQAFIPNEAEANIPQLINFQGALRQPNGDPVADGSYSVTFKIYGVANGGSAIWQESQSVATSNGVFNVLLGAVAPLPDTLFKDSTRFLGITVSPDGEMTPRHRLVSTGYAFSIPGYEVSGDNIILVKGTPALAKFGDSTGQVMRLGGSVGIGTVSPQSKMDVEGSVAIGAAFSGSAAAPADGLAVSGDVGIGTATPSSPTGFGRTMTLQATGFGPSIGLKNTNTGGQHFEIGSTVDLGGVNPRLDFFCPSSPNPIATLTSACRVGIGTETPSQKLEVVGNAKVSDTVFAGAFSSTSPLRLQTNGTTRIYADDVTGKVGIGTESPERSLDVLGGLTLGSFNGGSGVVDFYYDRDTYPLILGRVSQTGDLNGFQILTQGSPNGAGDITFFTGNLTANERMRITDDGNVGIGTANPNHKLEVAGTTEVQDQLSIEASGAGATPILDFDAGFNNKIGVLFRGNGSASNKSMALRLDQAVNSKLVIIQSSFNPNIDLQTGWTTPLVTFESGGNVGIGTANPGFLLDVAGACHASSFPTSSDIRLKKNIQPLSNVLEKLEKIRGVSFDWNETYEKLGRSTGHREIGVIAQDVEAVFPELVAQWGDEKYRGVDYGRMTAVLIEAVKELKSENDELKKRILKLEKSLPQARVEE